MWLVILLIVTLALDTSRTCSDAFVVKLPSASRSRIVVSSTRLYNNKHEIDKGFNVLEVASKVIPQGKLVETAKGSWKFLWKRFMTELAPQDKKTGSYQRPTYTFTGIVGSSDFPVQANRYHLFLGNPCPWCHRVALVIHVLGLQSLIQVTDLVDDPIRASRGGWVLPEPLRLGSNNKYAMDLRDVYQALVPGYTGRCTAPLLIDRATNKIVSNESKDIVRYLPRLVELLNEKPALNLFPPNLKAQIEETNEWVYRDINNGVYQCGFATTQQAYNQASVRVRQGLDRCNQMLSQETFLCGKDFTESDILLLPTMLRYAGVYSPLFKAGGTHVSLDRHYPNVQRWLRHCWQRVPGVKDSIDLEQACASYYQQLFPLNPGGILPYPPVSAAELGLED